MLPYKIINKGVVDKYKICWLSPYSDLFYMKRIIHRCPINTINLETTVACQNDESNTVYMQKGFLKQNNNNNQNKTNTQTNKTNPPKQKINKPPSIGINDKTLEMCKAQQ